MQNTGTSTWTNALNYRLASQVTGDPWGNRSYLAAGDSVAPGQQKTFTISATAPYVAGTYNFQWRMVEELVEFFGATTPLVSVTVIPQGVKSYSLTPCRLVDTRNPNGPYGGPALSTAVPRTFVAAGQCGIPANAKGVLFNAAAVSPGGNGYFTVYPANRPEPGASTLNYTSGQNLANNGVVGLDQFGQFTVDSHQAAGTVQFLFDVVGYLQ
jgi:hypothetical protein